ncbi:DDE-type integrase/transposase/recombinase [Sulfitobacter porphyrae]|uniref:DDE-type integrase/transposase/recombinase n=1 Tax=Sulfitobacter porphyrae TaxID=1246864 RepID=A0ABW2B585_9RHOB
MKIAGRSCSLWRSVDQHGIVLEEILKSRRDKRAEKRLLVKLMKLWGFVPKRIITPFVTLPRNALPGSE